MKRTLFESVEVTPKNMGGRPRATEKQAAVALAYHYFLPEYQTEEKRYTHTLSHKVMKRLAAGRPDAPFFYQTKDPVGSIKQLLMHKDNPVTNLLESAKPRVDGNEVRAGATTAMLVVFETSYGTRGATVLERPTITVEEKIIVVSGDGWYWFEGNKVAKFGKVILKALPTLFSPHDVLGEFS